MKNVTKVNRAAPDLSKGKEKESRLVPEYKRKAPDKTSGQAQQKLAEVAFFTAPN